MASTLNKLSVRAWTFLAVVMVLSTQLELSCTFLFPAELQDQADLLPEETLVFVGETLQMRCIIKDAGKVLPGDFKFTVFSNETKLSWNISSEDVKVINQTYAEVNVTVTDQFSKRNTVECWKGSKFLRATFLNAERPIQNITNFSGVYYYDQSKRIDLSWSLGVDYMNSTNVNVTIDYASNRCPNEQGSTCDNETNESCSFLGQAEDVIVVRIQVFLNSYRRPGPEYLQPLFGTNATSCHVFIPPYNLKTNPPGNLQVRPVSSTCFNVTWDPTTFFDDSETETIYQLKARKADNPLVEAVFEGRRPYIPGSQIIQICSLKPFTTYDIAFRVREDQLEHNRILWSDQALTTATTEEDKPLTGPIVTDTSYYAQDCFREIKEVFVYWNRPAAESVQGHLLVYEAAQVNTSQTLYSLNTSAHYARFLVDCNSDHQILIFCFTKIGKSLQPSQIWIPRKSEELPPLEDITVRLSKWNSSASVNWILGSQTPKNVVLLLYLFEEGNKPESGSNDFQVREVSLQLRQLNLTGLSSSSNLMFGYALQELNGNTSSKRGITWIDCVYDPQTRPDQPMVNLVSSNEDGSLNISWSSTRCNRFQKVMILWRHIFLCSQEVAADTADMNKYCKNITVSSKDSHHLVGGLKGGQTYFVYLQSESEAGLSLMSLPANGTPSENSLSSKIGLIIGVTLGVLLVACIILAILRKCHRSRSTVKYLVTETTHNDTKPKFQANSHTPSSNLETPPCSPAPNLHSTNRASLQQTTPTSHKLNVIKPSCIRQEINAICHKFRRKTHHLTGEAVHRTKSQATEDTAVDDITVISGGELRSNLNAGVDSSVEHLPQQTQVKATSPPNAMQQLPQNASSSGSVPYLRLTSTGYHDNSAEVSPPSVHLKPATLMAQMGTSSDPNFGKLDITYSSSESLQQCSQPDLEDEGYNSPQADANVPIFSGSPQAITNVPIVSGCIPQAQTLVSQLQHPSFPFAAPAVGQVYNCGQANSIFTVPAESHSVFAMSVNESIVVESNEITSHSDQNRIENTGHSDQNTNESTGHLDQSTNERTDHSDRNTIQLTSSYVTCTFNDNFEVVPSNTGHKLLTEESSATLSLSDTNMECQPISHLPLMENQPSSHPSQTPPEPGNQCQPIMCAPVILTECQHKMSPAFAQNIDSLANVGSRIIKNPLALFDISALNTSNGSYDSESSFCVEAGNEVHHDSSLDCPTPGSTMLPSGKSDYISSLDPHSPVTDYSRVASGT